MDLLNVVALGPQNVGNKHGCLLQSGARPLNAVLDGIPLPSGSLVMKMELVTQEPRADRTPSVAPIQGREGVAALHLRSR
jgi:hypothetical protein